MAPPTHTHARDLLDLYEAFLIDAFGVLVRGDGLLPGATDFIQALHDRHKPYLILTNDASRQPHQITDWYRRLGLIIDPDLVITSGSLLIDHFKAHDLIDAPTIALGPEGSLQYVRQAGGQLVAPDDDAAEVIAVCDDAGFDFLSGVEATLSTLFRRLDAGKNTHLVLPNPDLIYPKAPGQVGLTSGSVALIIEAAVQLRYPGRTEPRFHRLGKPHTPIYRAGQARLGELKTLMIGDQLATDILGANRAGIDAALVTTGVSLGHEDAQPAVPTWILSGLA